MPKQKKRRLADYSTSEMVKLCGMKASSTFENKRDKVFERYEIDPTLFKMDSSIEGGENFYPVVCAELLAILIKNWDKNPSSRKNANRDNVTVTQICDFYRALLKDVDDLPKELRGLIYKSCQSHFTTKCLVIWAERVVNGLALFTETHMDQPEENIGKLCFKHHVTVISDEIHCDIVEPGKKYVPFASACPECASNSVTCISASKAFSVAGLQSAAVFVPDERLRNIAVRGLNSDEVAEPNCFAAIATAAAFDKGEPWLDELNEYIAENKRFVCEFITKNLPSVALFEQLATYLMWLDCRDLCSDTDELYEFLRENTGLILSPGKKYRGDGRLYLRMNVACPRDKLLDGLKRLEKGVRSFSESKSKN